MGVNVKCKKNKNMYINRLLLLSTVFCFSTLSATDTLSVVKQKESFLYNKEAIPYCNSKSRILTSSSSSVVNGDELKNVFEPQLGLRMVGKIAGLHVVKKNGTPGNTDTPNLLIRGKQTFSDNSILVLVDGFETKWTNLIPDEIESITLLKDAASLALYGQKGANGVLLITTKRGCSNKKINVDFSSRFGIQSASYIPSFVNNGDYAELYNIAMKSDGKDISNGYFKDQTIVDYFKNQNYPFLYSDVNWYDNALKKNSFAQNYSISFNGGNDIAKFYAVLGFMNSQGLYANTNGTTNSNYDLKRYNVMTNVDIKLTEWLKTQVNFRGVIDDKSMPNVDEKGLWKNMGSFLPYNIKTPSGAWGGMQNFPENPIASILQKGYKTTNERTIDANIRFDVDLKSFLKGLSIFGLIGFSNNYYMHYNKTRGLLYEELLPRPDKIEAGVTPENEMPYDVIIRGSEGAFQHTQNSGVQWNRTTVMAGGNYAFKYKEHNLNLMAAYYQELYKTNGKEMPFAKQNILGKIEYSFNDKYLINWVMSYSGSENFMKGKRFGLFPALSLGWNLNKEDFYKCNNFIPLLKLRTSVGLTGNDRTGSSGRFIYEQNYVTGGNYFFGQNLSQTINYYKEGILANPNATWEKAIKYDLGFDMMLFDKLSLSATYFYERRKDIYVDPENYISSLIGASINDINQGKVKNLGIELEALWSHKISDISYYIGGRFTFARNTIIDKKEPIRPKNEEYLYAKGKPIGLPFVLEAIGFFENEEDIKNSPTQLFGEIKPGDVKYKDQNRDGFIDNNDRIPVGKPVYPELFYGFDTGIEYRGVDLGLSFSGVGNRTISLLDNNNIIPFLEGRKPTAWIMDNYWTPERSGNAKFPRLTTEQNENNYRESTLWQRSGNYLRINNIELGYTLPKNILKKINIENIRFYVNVVNPITFDKIEEINSDPEALSMFDYPTMKSYNIGFNLHF